MNFMSPEPHLPSGVGGQPSPRPPCLSKAHPKSGPRLLWLEGGTLKLSGRTCGTTGRAVSLCWAVGGDCCDSLRGICALGDCGRDGAAHSPGREMPFSM